jgi:hypothetical protein
VARRSGAVPLSHVDRGGVQIGKMLCSEVKDDSRIGSRQLAGMGEYAKSTVLYEEV